VGLLTSAYGIGPCIGTLIGGNFFFPAYGKWEFLLFSIPCCLVSIVIILPPFYRFMSLPKPSEVQYSLLPLVEGDQDDIDEKDNQHNDEMVDEKLDSK